MPTILTAHELAAIIDYHPTTLLEWARRGKIPSIKTARGVFFDLTKVVAALRERSAFQEQEAVPCT